MKSINLGTVYESVVAQELKAHGHRLYYYDNKAHGEVDFLIEDDDALAVLPLEIKSGKDYTEHSALNHFLTNKEYNIPKAYVLSNEREICQLASNFSVSHILNRIAAVYMMNMQK